MVVEVDGWSHSVTAAADAERTAWFAGRGYRVARLSNETALDRDRDLAAVLGALIFVVPDA